MKHINLKILILLLITFIQSEEIFINKKIAFDINHSTFEIFSDSTYYILSNIADKDYTKKRGAITIINKDGKIAETFSSITKPTSKKFIKVIEKLI